MKPHISGRQIALSLAIFALAVPGRCISVAGEPVREPLWPLGAPGAKGDGPTDRPMITVYSPPADLHTGTAVIICPGGGYDHLAVGHEGHDIAQWLVSIGVTGVLLEYRMYGGGYVHPIPLLDAQRAIRTVRARAAELGLDPSRVGILGFSAGGHLASTAGTHFDAGDPQAADPVDRVSCRPDFMVLCYPVIAFGEAHSHKGSQRNLIGADPPAELVTGLSSEKQVTRDTPPTFLFHTDEDTSVPPENSVAFYLALRAAGVPAELHIYRSGKHGLGLARDVPGTAGWAGACEQWLRGQGWLGPPEAVSHTEGTRVVPIAEGWAQTSVNAVIFRRNSVVSDDHHQVVAYYDADANVVLASRRLGTAIWNLRTTPYKGNTRDAHNAISIIIDGEGFLHMAWDHHDSALRYCRGTESGSIELAAEQSMTGIKEDRVTYPEFYRLPDGNLLFLYRDGESGSGNLMMNHYDTATKTWVQLHDGLIDGEGDRNAYWQMAVDPAGVLHLSWVWRETWDVASNHDLGYARSVDGGQTWEKSTGEAYPARITAGNAEYACRIPQGSGLINQTAMCADAKGRPYIATYWQPEGQAVPQYHVVYHNGSGWQTTQVTLRRTPFSLSGNGTRKIPISRPQIVVDGGAEGPTVYMIYRDAERDNRASVAICDDLAAAAWRVKDLTTESLGSWEPSYDTEMWNRSNTLHLFVQRVGQGDGEQTEDIPPQPITILEWQPE